MTLESTRRSEVASVSAELQCNLKLTFKLELLGVFWPCLNINVAAKYIETLLK